MKNENFSTAIINTHNFVRAKFNFFMEKCRLMIKDIFQQRFINMQTFIENDNFLLLFNLNVTLTSILRLDYANTKLLIKSAFCCIEIGLY
jgi:hypothetical protein